MASSFTSSAGAMEAGGALALASCGAADMSCKSASMPSMSIAAPLMRNGGVAAAELEAAGATCDCFRVTLATVPPPLELRAAPAAAAAA